MNPLLLLVLISCAGSVLGSLFGIFATPTKRFMYNMLSFAAGVMLGISFMELIPQGIALSSTGTCIAGIIAGALLMYVMDKLLPHIHPELCSQEHGHTLQKTAAYMLVGIALHNFPEGMAIAVGTVTDFKLSVAIALAIAIHDIPEGVCTSAPYYFVNRNRLKTFLVSASTAIPTLLGFIVSYYLFSFIPLWAVGFLVSGTAGLMIYIAADELIPIASKKMTEHSTIFSLIAGVILVVLLRAMLLSSTKG